MENKQHYKNGIIKKIMTNHFVVATMAVSYVIKDDISVVYDYQGILQLCNKQTEMLCQHRRYWKNCGGNQQSIPNRDLLHKRADECGDTLLSPSFPACGMCNISAVEKKCRIE